MNDLLILNQYELIPLQQDENGQVIIDGRKLHEFLKVQQDFTDWMKKQLGSIGAKEGKEFSSLKGKTSENGGRPTTDYILTLDIAKEICMVAGVAPRINKETKELSKQARQYFITIEKAWNSPEMVIKRALEIADRKVKLLQIENSKLIKENDSNKPKVHYHDWVLNSPSLMPITSIAKDYGMTAEEMNKLLKDLKVQFKMGDQWILYRKYDSKGYTSSKTLTIKHNTKPTEVKNQTQWTQKGRKFIYELLENQGILPLIEREAI